MTKLNDAQRAEKAANTAAKEKARRRDTLIDQLRNLGARRHGLTKETDHVAAVTEELVPKGADAGITYEELAALTGLSRARIGQLLAAHRKQHPPTDTEPAPDDGLVAAVGDL